MQRSHVWVLAGCLVAPLVGAQPATEPPAAAAGVARDEPRRRIEQVRSRRRCSRAARSPALLPSSTRYVTSIARGVLPGPLRLRRTPRNRQHRHLGRPPHRDQHAPDRLGVTELDSCSLTFRWLLVTPAW